MSIFTLHVVFPLVPILKCRNISLQSSCMKTFSSLSIFTLHGSNKCSISPCSYSEMPIVLCDNCLVYGTSLVSNNYLGSNKCSVDTLHLIFPLVSVFCATLSSWECLSLHFTVCIQTPLYSNNYQFKLLSVWNNSFLSWECYLLHFTFHFYPCSYSVEMPCFTYLSSSRRISPCCTSIRLLSFRNAVFCAITVLYTVPL